jgi:hypothetical protein
MKQCTRAHSRYSAGGPCTPKLELRKYRADVQGLYAPASRRGRSVRCPNLLRRKRRGAVGTEHLRYLRSARWRGVWTAEERRRRADNDLGYTLYLGMPYYARWIWAAAKMLVDKKHISLAELQEKIAEVKSRYEKK